MKYSSNCVYALLAFFFSGCEVMSEMKLQSRSEAIITKNTPISFRYIKKLIVVDAHLNQSATPNSFIFDTGAFQSKVAYPLAEEHNLKTVTKRSNGTAQGIEREIEITSIASLRTANTNFIHIGAGKVIYDSKSYTPCIAEDGIIGANLIKLAHWKLDFEKKEMEVSKDPFPKNPDATYHQLKFETSFLSGVPKINVEIEGLVIEDVVFDLGYNGGLVVPYSFAKHFDSERTQTLIDQSTSGIFGSNRDTLLVKELNVGFGGYQTKMPVQFSSLNKALLGNDVLEHFTIHLNYDDDTILLRPVSSVSIDKVKTFIPGILNDSLWIVDRTRPRLPVRIGDTLNTINGHRPKDLFKSHCDYFLNLTKLLASDTLLIRAKNGNQFKINLNPTDEKH